jgi:hypothetical protein
VAATTTATAATTAGGRSCLIDWPFVFPFSFSVLVSPATDRASSTITKTPLFLFMLIFDADVDRAVPLGLDLDAVVLSIIARDAERDAVDNHSYITAVVVAGQGSLGLTGRGALGAAVDRPMAAATIGRVAAGDSADRVKREGLPFGATTTAGVLLIGLCFGDVTFDVSEFGRTRSDPASVGTKTRGGGNYSGGLVVLVVIGSGFSWESWSLLLCVGLLSQWGKLTV